MCFALFSCTACSPLGFLLGKWILWLRRAAGICPTHHSPSLQDSCSCRDPARLSVCTGTAGGVQPIHFPVMIPGVEPDGKRLMEIKVHLLEALRDVFMEAHTHQHWICSKGEVFSFSPSRYLIGFSKAQGRETQNKGMIVIKKVLQDARTWSFLLKK